MFIKLSNTWNPILGQPNVDKGWAGVKITENVWTPVMGGPNAFHQENLDPLYDVLENINAR